MELLAGIDVGTTGCKIAVYREDGGCVAKKRREYGVEFPAPGWAEQDPTLWWNALRTCFRELFAEGIKPEDIRAMALSAQAPTLIPVDAEGNPLTRAILWMDSRAVEESRELRNLGLNCSDATYFMPKLFWLKKNRPEIHESCSRYLCAMSFLNRRLCGEAATDWYSAAMAGYDVEKGRWDEDLLSAVGVDEELLPEVRRPGEVLGTLSGEASEELGLPRDVVVVLGGVDGVLASLGVACLEEGSAYEITGHSTVVASLTRRRMPYGPNLPLMPFLIDGLWIAGGFTSSTGAILRWFRDSFGVDEDLRGVVGGGDYDLLCYEASLCPPGAEGLILLPYFAGERSPIWDPKARGVLFGITLKHGRKNFVRSILESCGFAIRHLIEDLKLRGVEVEELRSSGGGSKNPVWSKIKADITNLKVITFEEPDASLLGAAILAGMAAGFWNDLRRACIEMVRVKEVFEPDPRLRRLYDRRFALYKVLYERLKELFPELEDDVDEE